MKGYPFNAFEPVITQKLLELLKPNDIVIDVGSRIGYYALLCAKKASKVITIEPSSDSVRRIRENIALNQFQNIEVLNCAIREEYGLGLREGKKGFRTFYERSGREER